ncbi:hypothetical protein [Pseudaestuariivita rosea]|uniref:hypothetical protein n=1 Tax=Pseudaestuariivita rosea TaxID=2763263 RepID=UPI001ABBB9F0|nr:hypothetical protein [Pseudaestuariivita rosea]
MDEAVGYAIARGQDYTRNMRRGDINSTFADLTYHWLMEHHFDLAHRISPEIFPETPEQRWQAILDKRAITDRFRLVLVPQSLGIVQRKSQLKPAGTTLRLGQRFCFELDSEIEGYAVALQGVRGQWHSIPLGSDGSVIAPLKRGINQLPRTTDGTLDPLSENDDEGQHEFVLVTAQTQDIPSDIKNLITWVNDVSLQLHRTRVQFVK